VVKIDENSALMSTLEKAIKELPRDKEVVQLYQKLAGADPLPARERERSRRQSG
jgi:hypothetical protein